MAGLKCYTSPHKLFEAMSLYFEAMLYIPNMDFPDEMHQTVPQVKLLL